MKGKVNDFLKKINDVAVQLQEFSHTIKGKEEQIHTALNKLSFSISKAESTVAENNFGKVIIESTNLIKLQVQQWIKMVENHIEGKEFINQFEKSVVITVFGNVNTGKSSLGNFMAGRVDGLQKFYLQAPDLFTYDFNDGKTEAKIINEKMFKEGVTETTTTIQYFTLLNGLTWVDTPGIHSINLQNEQLAKKYVDFADLILFLVPSSSPGKADEIEEVGKMIEKQKSLLVAITKSDEIFKDEVDGKTIQIERPKSLDKRKIQEGYMADTLAEKRLQNKIKDMRFTSMSVKIAKRALLEEDSQMFIDSGLPAFYEQLGNVLSTSAIDLKKQRPIALLNTTIDELVDGFEGGEGLNQIINQLDRIRLKFKEDKDSLLNEKVNLIRILNAKAKIELDVEMSRLRQEFNHGANITSKDIGIAIEKSIFKHYHETVQQRLINLLADVHVEHCSALQIALEVKFEKTYETVESHHYDVVEKTRDPKNLLEYVGAFFGKEFKEIAIQTHIKQNKITVGDNFSKVLTQSYDELERQVKEIVTNSIEDIKYDYFYKNESIMEAVIEELKEVKLELVELKITGGGTA